MRVVHATPWPVEVSFSGLIPQDPTVRFPPQGCDFLICRTAASKKFEKQTDRLEYERTATRLSGDASTYSGARRDIQKRSIHEIRIPGLAAHLAGEVTTLATCWRLGRADGWVRGFTDYDSELVVDGLTYVASTGFLPSAIKTASDLFGAVALVRRRLVRSFWGRGRGWWRRRW